jgi:hypothetical protein
VPGVGRDLVVSLNTPRAGKRREAFDMYAAAFDLLHAVQAFNSITGSGAYAH